MKSLGNNIFVRIPKKYKDEIILSNGMALYFDPSYDKFKNRAVDGIVTSVPPHLSDVFMEGDRVWYHDSIIRGKNRVIDWKNSTFKVQYDRADTFDCLIYLIERNGKRFTTNHFVFIKPIKPVVKEKIGSIFIPQLNEPKIYSAEIVYANDRLPLEVGANIGDTIVFAKNSEYEMEIDGQILYRTKLDNILAILEHNGKEERVI
jgi:co-chaperonin GroES (HSP10)